MNRAGLIKKLSGIKRKIGYRLKNHDYESRKDTFKDMKRFCSLEKEIEIQKAYEEHESR